MVERSELPDYESPPVSEVVIGLRFKPLLALRVPHIGLLWERFREEFPSCEHAPPLGLEDVFAGKPDVPWPVPRVWFVNRSEDRVVQIQNDRAYFNWRSRSKDTRYPRYPAILEMYERGIAMISEFLKDEGLGEIIPVEYELKYVNHIPKGTAWQNASDIPKIFADLTWRCLQDRFLPDPIGGDWTVVFPLPPKSGRLTARFYAGVRRIPSLVEEQIVVLEMTANGPSIGSEVPPARQWFDLGHEWIVRGFADLTSLDVQTKVWKRTNARA